MAISCNKNQPIFFEDDFNCNPCVSEYCIPVETGDTSYIQVGLSEISGNLISNGNFASSSGWTLDPEWTIGTGKATFSGVSGGDMSRTTDYALTEGYYLVKIDITLLNIDYLSLSISLGGQGVFATSGISTSGWTDRTYYFYGYITPSSNTLLISGGSGYSISVDNIEVYKLSEVEYDIKDCDTDEVLYTNNTNTNIVYFESGSMTSGTEYFEYLQGLATITLNWTTLALGEGCFCICVKDGGLLGYERVKNGFFGSSSDWTITNSGTGWTIGAGVAEHVSGGAAGNDDLEQTLTAVLDSTIDYTLTFDLVFVSGAGDAAMDILYDTALLTNQTLISYPAIAAGFSGSIAINNIAITKIRFRSTAAGLRTFSLDNVSILATEASLLCEENSNCISVRTDWDAFCTTRKMCNILVNATNTNSAFGFSAGYDFKGRVFGQIRNGIGRDNETVIYRDLSGLSALEYSERTKVKELQVFQVPQGVHDWLELALSSQTVNLTINGVTKEFVKVAGDYSPNWRKTSSDAPVIVEIFEAQQVPNNARNA